MRSQRLTDPSVTDMSCGCFETRSFSSKFREENFWFQTEQNIDVSLNYWTSWLICFFLRHWLALLLTPALIFVTIPFLAPIAMHNGWTGTGQVIYWLYAPFCHQLPQRSWFLFGAKLTYTLEEINQTYPYTEWWQLRQFVGTPELGWKVAWSDRMVSFYFMTPIFGLLYALLRQFQIKIPPLSLRALLLSLAPLTFDGLTRLLSDSLPLTLGGGFRDTNGWLVLLTANAFPTFYAGDAAGTFNWWLRLVTGIVAAAGIAFCTFPLLNQILQDEQQKYCH